MAELNVSETQLAQQIALVQTGRQAAEAQLAGLEQAKQAYDEAKAHNERASHAVRPVAADLIKALPHLDRDRVHICCLVKFQNDSGCIRLIKI